MAAEQECTQGYTRGTGLQHCKGYVDCDSMPESMTENVVTETAQTGNGEGSGKKDEIVSDWWTGILSRYLSI